jgi:hypothetical protein
MIAIAYASPAASDRRNNRRETIEVPEFHLCLAQRSVAASVGGRVRAKNGRDTCLQKMCLPCSVEGISPSRSRACRILEAFVDRRNDGQTSVWRLECEMA